MARYNLAVLLSRIGHDDQALRLYEDNMQRGWNLPTVVNLSALYAKHGESDRAQKLLHESTKHFPNEAIPWYLLADMASHAKRDAEARKDFEQAIRADPKNGFARIRYARFLVTHGELSAALKQSSRAVSLLPDIAESWTTHGDILIRAGKLDSALIAYQKSAALNPDRNIRRRIIATLHKLGKNARADRMEQALRRESDMQKGEQ